MLHLQLKVLIVAFVICVYVQSGGSQYCQSRDTSLIQDGRRCMKTCASDTKCRNPRKRCICDDECGLSCLNPNLVCPELSPIANGTINYPTTRRYNQVVTYSCDAGYFMNGSLYRTCRSDKKWSGSAPTCYIGCPRPKRTGSFYVLDDKDSYFPGESVLYECRYGFKISGNGSVTCLGNGAWSKNRFVCSSKVCKIPRAPDNGYKSGSDYKFGRRVFFYCNKGYRMVEAQNFISCTAEAEWEGDVPTCEKVRCSAPLAPDHGSVNDRNVDYTYNNIVIYSCDVGYKLEGNGRGICNENRTWGKVPTCKEIKCAPPLPPSNGFITPARSSFRYNERITFECNSGYQLETGSNIATCQLDQTWSSSATLCQEIKCDVPRNFENGRLSSNLQQLPIGATITFTCNDNYVLDDQSSATATCQSNGTWSSMVPTCKYDQLQSWGNWGPCSCDSGKQRRFRRCRKVNPGSPICSGSSSEETKSCNGHCGPYKLIYGSRIYQFFQTARSFQASRRHCQYLGGDLAKIPNYEVNQHLTKKIDILTSSWNHFWGEDYFIGLTDSQQERIWKWIDENSTTQYSRWGESEPNGRTYENCGTLNSKSGKWKDYSCNRQLYYICERAVVGEWGSWSACSATCGVGEQSRTRLCPGASIYCRKYKTTQRIVCNNTIPCPHEQTEISARKFTFVKLLKTYSAARTHCQSLGGDLAVIRKNTVQVAVSQKIKQLSSFLDKTNYFLGMNRNTNRKLQWIDGTIVPLHSNNGGLYQNWYSGEPNNNGRSEGCAVINPENGKWNDVPCRKTFYYICEQELNPCNDKPCLRNGSCHILSRTTYVCSCPRYVRGKHCETIRNACWSNPCLNGASCSGNAISYSCECSEDFSGKNCGQRISHCGYDRSRLQAGVVVRSTPNQRHRNGTKLSISCQNDDQSLNVLVDEITCQDDGRWMPDYTLLECS